MTVAIVSSLKDQPTDPQAVVIGEVGLGGEIRTVHQADRRIAEAAKLGFKRAIIPKQNLHTRSVNAPIEVVEVETVGQAIDALLGG
jgi:DNA repair protein RadA/Sms